MENIRYHGFNELENYFLNKRRINLAKIRELEIKNKEYERYLVELCKGIKSLKTRRKKS